MSVRIWNAARPVRACRCSHDYRRGVTRSGSYASVAARQPASQPGRVRNSFVVKNLKYSKKEDEDKQVTVNKVQALLRDGLKIKNVKVLSAERKGARDDRPGLIITEVESAEQKKSIFKCKRQLRGNKVYPDVYINDDLPFELRQTEASLRTLVREMGKENQYTVRGARLITKSRT